MGTGMGPIWAISVTCIFLVLGAPKAQTPPAESTSKVKRVLLYNKIGGWYCGTCRDRATEVFFNLAQSKGFSVDTTSSVAGLTLENLKRYQVIVWNNNTNGAASVPDSVARKAVSEYVRQGGGWMLVNLANEHVRSWPFLDSLIGPGTSGWQGNSVPAVLVADSSAQKHPELRFFVTAFPDSIPLSTNWLRVNSDMDLIEGFQPIYRVVNAAWIKSAPAYYSEKYIWAGTHEKGKALAIPLGWYGSSILGVDIMTQAGNAVPGLYWQGLRWLAGDYRNGCINPVMPNFNAEARVDDGSCQALGIRTDRRYSWSKVGITGRHVRFSPPISGGGRMRLLDLRGHAVWSSTAPKSADAFDLPDGLLAGLYILETTGANISFRARIFVP